MSLSHILSSLNPTATGNASSQPPSLSITVPSLKSASKLGFTSVSTGGTSLSASASAMVTGIFEFTGATSAATWTPPSSVAMYNYLVTQGITPVSGSSFQFYILNNNSSSGAVTPQVATGVTYFTSGSGASASAIAINTSQLCWWVFTAAAGASAVIYY